MHHPQAVLEGDPLRQQRLTRPKAEAKLGPPVDDEWPRDRSRDLPKHQVDHKMASDALGNFTRSSSGELSISWYQLLAGCRF